MKINEKNKERMRTLADRIKPGKRQTDEDALLIILDFAESAWSDPYFHHPSKEEESK